MSEPVTMFRVEKDGEAPQCVADPENYPDWAVTAIGDDAVPVEGGVWDGERYAVPLPVLKQRKKDAITRSAVAHLRQGYSPAAGPLAGETLQLRDEDDKSNWLTSQGTYTAMVAAGYGATPNAHFRTASNRVVTMTYADGLNQLLGMAAWGAAVLGVSWSLKDAVDAATTPEEVEAVAWPE